MRKVLSVVTLTIAAGVASLAFNAPTANAAPIGPCDLQDTPNANYDGRTVTLDLHTQVECFKTVYSVG